MFLVLTEIPQDYLQNEKYFCNSNHADRQIMKLEIK